MKIRFTKGELKRQRDDLRQFQRYLPTLQLKKQQLQIEILHQRKSLEEKKQDARANKETVLVWAKLLAEPQVNLRPWVRPKKIAIDVRNVAGVEVPVFKGCEFNPAEYDLFITPLWVDGAVEALRIQASLRAEISVLEQGEEVLKTELRITTQRVNLFEKIKIPQAKEAIRKIKIYIGDQTANAVGRSKIAKRKIEELLLQGAIA
ncbi:MAG: V-type ATP synthase subunit D [Candidatus Omnitrophica bacterium]|nr:V-type ATP synthase subunit D [Candidatus Omnitrophota bacterium]